MIEQNITIRIHSFDRETLEKVGFPTQHLALVSDQELAQIKAKIELHYEEILFDELAYDIELLQELKVAYSKNTEQIEEPSTHPSKF